jgi:hypothetical protein
MGTAATPAPPWATASSRRWHCRQATRSAARQNDLEDGEAPVPATSILAKTRGVLRATLPDEDHEDAPHPLATSASPCP